MYNFFNNKRYRPYFKSIGNNEYDIQYPPNAIKTDDIYSQMRELAEKEKLKRGNIGIKKLFKKNLSRYSYFYSQQFCKNLPMIFQNEKSLFEN